MLIRVENLKVSYRSGTETLTVLDIPAWFMEEARQIAVAGPSGSGKSTFLNLLSGLLLPSSGSVEICSEKISEMSEYDRDRFRGRHISYIFQSLNLLQGYTALENVLLGASFSAGRAERKEAEYLLEETGLAARMKHMPSELSIGEQQRVAIARALIKKPALVLADEPTGSLDRKRGRSMIELLQKVCLERQAALITVTHDLDAVKAFPESMDFAVINRAFSGEENS